MKKEWIEQPAFETNDFKVGDMVRVYGTDYIFIGKIDMHVVEGQDMIHVQGKTEDSISDYFHFKQCRLLKKKPPDIYYATADYGASGGLVLVGALSASERGFKVQTGCHVCGEEFK